jgi:cytochrome o ubiquinol oxidase subunit 1
VVGSGGIRTAIILVGLACHIVQLVVSIRNREKLRDVTDDP